MVVSEPFPSYLYLGLLCLNLHNLNPRGRDLFLWGDELIAVSENIYYPK
jgi:hypothetical protein